MYILFIKINYSINWRLDQGSISEIRAEDRHVDMAVPPILHFFKYMYEQLDGERQLSI